LLSAKVWQPKNKLDWVNIGSNDDQLGLLLLNKSGDMVETTLDKVWLLLVNGLLVSFSLSLFGESLFLLFFILGFVFL
jgi:hypothetical protein